MPFNLREALPKLLPGATEWVRQQEKIILDTGLPLRDDYLKLAELAGVRFPQKIRIREVPSIPLPTDPELRLAALQSGLLGPRVAGITFGYGIYLIEGGMKQRKLIAHECRHVAQYEGYGSIQNFLIAYLNQIIDYGYEDAPLELEARQFAHLD